MKKYIDKETGNRIIIADAQTIKAIYKSIARKDNDIYPVYSLFPKFWKNHMYALILRDSRLYTYMAVANADTALDCIINGDWEEVIK